MNKAIPISFAILVLGILAYVIYTQMKSKPKVATVYPDYYYPPIASPMPIVPINTILPDSGAVSGLPVSGGLPIDQIWPRPDMTTFPEFTIPLYKGGGNVPPGPCTGPNCPPPPPPPPPPTCTLTASQTTNLVNYFKALWPNMTGVTDPCVLQNAYSKLDVYYTDLITGLNKPIAAAYKTDRMASLTAIDGDKDLDYSRLFDGNVCDCLRVNHKECIYSPNRLTPNELKDCRTWPYMLVNISPQWLLQRAYDTDNPDNNYRKDTIVRTGMSGKKGFPNFAYYEGFVFPGEYGIPDLCAKTPPDPWFNELQKGLKTTSGQAINIKNSSSPWWYNDDCASVPCPFTDMDCTTIVSDGTTGGPQAKGTFRRCLRQGAYGIGDKMPASYNSSNSSVIENLTTTLDPDCPGGFPPNVCAEVKPKDYRGYWTYPLVGCGTWWTVGKSTAVNTKLGLLIGKKSEFGMELDLEDLMKLRTQTNAFEQNLYQQVKRVSEIIRNGSVPANGTMWSAMDLAMLQKHGYKGDKVTDQTAAWKAAKDLVSYWYLEGYTGIEQGITNGFNYNYTKYFPLGCHFAYASRFDHLLTSWMTVQKLDSIQFLVEPQNVKVGLRPAYMFEVFSKKPRTAEAMVDSAFQDITVTQCRACFSCDPGPTLDTFLKQGYLPKSAVPNPKVIDPTTFTVRASVKSFTPIA